MQKFCWCLDELKTTRDHYDVTNCRKFDSDLTTPFPSFFFALLNFINCWSFSNWITTVCFPKIFHLLCYNMYDMQVEVDWSLKLETFYWDTPLSALLPFIDKTFLIFLNFMPQGITLKSSNIFLVVVSIKLELIF